MKTKLLGVVAACALALTVGTANATTYDINIGPFPYAGGSCPPPSDEICYRELAADNFAPGPPISGTFEINNGVLSHVNVTAEPFFSLFHVGFVTSYTSADVWTVHLVTGGAPGFDLTFGDDFGAVISPVYTYLADYPDAVVTYTGAVGTITTPLPATLPLFATGLAGLGLLGWRRKKAAAG
jgi:hypothetical protein